MYDERYTTRGSVLDEAKKLTTGDRNASYGPPDQDFARTAGMLNAMFGEKLTAGQKFLPEDVAKIVICIKLSRSMWSENRDHFVDICGYAACAYECITARSGKPDTMLGDGTCAPLTEDKP